MTSVSDTCEIFELYAVVKVIALIIGATALILCLLVFRHFLVTSVRKKVEQSPMILFLSTVDFALALLSIFEGFGLACNSSQGCLIARFSAQFFSLCSLIWTAAIVHSSYHTVSLFCHSWNKIVISHNVNDIVHYNQSSQMIWYHVMCWAVPALLVGVTMAGCMSESVCQHCQLFDFSSVRSNSYVWFTLLAYVIPVFLLQAYTIFVHRRLMQMVKQVPFLDETFPNLKRRHIILIIFKSVFVITSTVDVMEMLRFSDIALAIFRVISVIGSSSQGIGDYCVFRYGRIGVGGGASETVFSTLSVLFARQRINDGEGTSSGSAQSISNKANRSYSIHSDSMMLSRVEEEAAENKLQSDSPVGSANVGALIRYSRIPPTSPFTVVYSHTDSPMIPGLDPLDNAFTVTSREENSSGAPIWKSDNPIPGENSPIPQQSSFCRMWSKLLAGRDISTSQYDSLLAASAYSSSSSMRGSSASPTSHSRPLREYAQVETQVGGTGNDGIRIHGNGADNSAASPSSLRSLQAGGRSFASSGNGSDVIDVSVTFEVDDEAES